MRALKRSREVLYDNTRLILFELINGNPNIKKSSKPRRITDIFELSIDVKVDIEPFRISQEQAKNLKVKRGWNIPECFIKQQDGE